MIQAPILYRLLLYYDDDDKDERDDDDDDASDDYDYLFSNSDSTKASNSTNERVIVSLFLGVSDSYLHKGFTGIKGLGIGASLYKQVQFRV